MGLINWIFDLYQHSRIDDVRREAAEARAELQRLHTRGGGVDAERLEEALGEMALAIKTLQRLMLEKGVCTHEELAASMRRIDLEDGRADGRSSL